MAYNLHVWVLSVEFFHIFLHGLFLGFRAGVLGLQAPVTASYIHDVAAHTIEPCSTVGHLPWINLCILVVVNKAFTLPIQMEHVGIAYLLPPVAFRLRVAVPVPDVGTGHLATFRGCGAVDDEIFQLCHEESGLFARLILRTFRSSGLSQNGIYLLITLELLSEFAVNK